MPDKTKATLPGSQSINSKRIGIQITTLIGLVNLEAGNPASVMLAAQSGEVLRGSDADAQINYTTQGYEALRVTQSHAQNIRLSFSESVAAGGSPEKSGGQTPKMADAHSLTSLLPRPNIFLQIVVNWSFKSLLHVAGGAEMNLTANKITATMTIRNTHLRIIYPFDVQCPEKNRNIQKATVITTIMTVCECLSISLTPLENGYQPFGSIPCRKSSLRASAFSQLPRLTPSRLAASFSCWRSSGVIRIWKVGDRPSPFGVLSLLIVDMYVRNFLLWILLCTYVITEYVKKATPRTARTVPGRLTKPLTEVTIMAESQSTQTRPKFTWRFLAVGASTPDMRPIILYTNAPTEEEARENCPGWILYFAARLPLCIPESMEVRHV